MLEGGEVNVTCGPVHSNKAVVMAGDARTRRLCTPYTDLTSTGSLLFFYTHGGSSCMCAPIRRPGDTVEELLVEHHVHVHVHLGHDKLHFTLAILYQNLTLGRRQCSLSSDPDMEVLVFVEDQFAHTVALTKLSVTSSVRTHSINLL